MHARRSSLPETPDGAKALSPEDHVAALASLASADVMAYAADLIAELRQLTAHSGTPRLAECLAEAEAEARRSRERPPA